MEIKMSARKYITIATKDKFGDQKP